MAVSRIGGPSSISTYYPVDPIPTVRAVKRRLPTEEDKLLPSAEAAKRQKLAADDQLYPAPAPDDLTVVPPLAIDSPITDAEREEFDELVRRFKAVAGPDFERMMAELFKNAVELQEQDLDLNVELLKMAHKFSISLSEEKQKAMEQLAAEISRSALFQKLQFAAGALGLVGLGVAASTATGPVGIVFALTALTIVGAATIDSMAGDPAKRFVAEQLIARAITKVFATDETKTKEWSLFGVTLGVTAVAATLSLGTGLLTITSSASTLLLAVNVISGLASGTTSIGTALTDMRREKETGHVFELSGEGMQLSKKREAITRKFGSSTDKLANLQRERRQWADQALNTTRAVVRQSS